MLRRLLGLVGGSSLLIAVPLGVAGAADMPVKAPPLLVAPCMWCGWYVGGQVGGLWDRDQLTETSSFVPPTTGNSTTYPSGIVGGAHLGYNWQFDRFVLGPEIDIEGTSLNNTNSCLVQDFGAGNAAPGTCFGPSYSFSTSVPWQASVRGRVGYTWGNKLLYVTGGIEFADVKTNYTTISGYITTGSQSFEQTRAGGTVGAGFEYKYAEHWIGRLEYRYTDLGNVANAITSGGGFWNGYTDTHQIQENQFEVGLSYLFTGH